VKASKSSIGRAVDQPDRKVRFYLFVGQDEAQSRALAARLLEALGAQKFAVSTAAVKANPSLLADEAAALSLFGERRLIWVEPAGNDLVEGVEALLAAEAVESPVAAIAGALPKSSALLKLAEASPHALAFTAYLPEGDDAARLVSDIGRRVGLKASAPVAARVAGACGNDQAIITQELEKLSIYLDASPHAPKELDHEAVDAVGADSSEGDFQRLADLALLGKVSEVSDAIGALPAGSSAAIPAVRSLHRRLLMLAPARARVERGESVDAVMTSLGKALFWKDKDAVGRMLRSWSAEELARVAERAGALERTLLFSAAPERESLGEELLAIARKARAAR
jgi:DNA polymerase-3 subunit delta